MLIVQITDTHLAGWDEMTYGVAPMDQNLSLCIDHINQLSPEPDLILVTGDIVSSGRKEEYEQVVSLLNKFNAPYFVIPGNHDNKLNFIEAFSGTACYSIKDSSNSEKEFINYVINDYDLRLIGVDSTVLNGPGGEICETRAIWLNDRLAEDTKKPTVIFMHHPPVKLGVRESNIDGFIGSERLGAIIENYSNIERILCGHIHLPTFVRWHGTIVSTAPSMGMPLVLDLTMEQTSRFLLDSPAYQLHHWTAENNLVSHTISVKQENKSYSFEHYSDIGR
ncbi:MAG: phosphodiesterase [Thiotrichaceae bacterium]|nr:phosphodiesterase [Thiotrichaceae bacterium]